MENWDGEKFQKWNKNAEEISSLLEDGKNYNKAIYKNEKRLVSDLRMITW